MEKNIVIACDDGRVNKLGTGKTIEACIVYSCSTHAILDAGFLWIHVDGLDATSQLVFMLKILSSRTTHPSAIFLDSLTTGGFNIISPPSLYNTVKAPIITLYKRKPRYDKIVKALTKHFYDYDVRLRVLSLLENTTVIPTRKGVLYSVTWGISVDDAIKIVESCQVHSRIPEPLRLVHYFASESSRILIPKY